MSTVISFNGVKIKVNARDHSPPHAHVEGKYGLGANTMKNNKIIYGKKDLLPAKIAPKDVSIRISIVMEGDLLNAIKASAAAKGVPYQTLLKTYLRDQFIPANPKRSDREEREHMLEMLRELGERVERVENRKKRA